MIRRATNADASILTQLNQQLIRDSGHRNPMTLEQLQQRMNSWLVEGYEAIVYEESGLILGYVLFRHDVDHTYLRQLFVIAEARRRGIGRALITWLIENVTFINQRLRIEVLVNNTQAIEFWRAIGFRDYCVTMELEN